MKKYILTLAVTGLLAGVVLAQEQKAEGPEPFNGNGVAMGPVSAIDPVKNEIIIGDSIIKIGAADIAKLKVGDDVTVNVFKGRKTMVRKAGEKPGPQPFKGNGVAMGPISAVDAVKNEIIIGDNIIKIGAADIARLKVGDDVTVVVGKGKKTSVIKAGDKAEPEAFNGVSGQNIGPVESIDPVKNEIVVAGTIFKVTPEDICGLKAGDRAKVTVNKGRTTVIKLAQ